MKLLGVLVALLFAGACADDESIHDVVTCESTLQPGNSFACERVCRDEFVGHGGNPDGMCLGTNLEGLHSAGMAPYRTLGDGTRGYCADGARDGKPLFEFYECDPQN